MRLLRNACNHTEFFLIPIVAVTSFNEIMNSLKFSSTEIFEGRMPLLSFQQSLDLFRQCGVSDEYFANLDFLQLMSDAGGIPRVLQRIFTRLEFTFSSDSIVAARRCAEAYLGAFLSRLKSEELVGIIRDVLLGNFVNQIAYSDYQSSGVVWLTKADSAFEIYFVEMPFIALYMTCQKLVSNRLHPVKFLTHALELLEMSTIRKWEDFEKFVTFYHVFKTEYGYYDANGVTTLSSFYGLSPGRADDLTIKHNKLRAYGVKTALYRFLNSRTSKNELHNEYVDEVISGKAILNTEGARVG